MIRSIYRPPDWPEGMELTSGPTYALVPGVPRHHEHGLSWYGKQAALSFRKAGYTWPQMQAEKKALMQAGFSWEMIWLAAQARAAIR
jgi:hypothetical protein